MRYLLALVAFVGLGTFACGGSFNARQACDEGYDACKKLFTDCGDDRELPTKEEACAVYDTNYENCSNASEIEAVLKFDFSTLFECVDNQLVYQDGKSMADLPAVPPCKL